ncbi:hypothetical protein, conserved [Eimeria tenella]|uniref:Reverse transcriptase, related n=1 Tax=Eimeria tenella TaxID=5802 RepID=U6KNS8_EIMTE|nr:hypothetical protein, conserved [Eimeria tenella]CDJ37108.1 hypothetical protein, conserved [Eimeria tenella]|eukprot:XP_013227946.1 hypothetical protein, conserved [Eimeria tenella]
MMRAVATGPNSIPVSHELGNQLLRTAGGADKSDERAEGTPPLPETRRESGSESTLSEETPDATINSSRKSAETIEDGYRSDAREIVPHWWRETCTKESYDQAGALCCAGATAVLRVELAGSPCEALLDTAASRSFISFKIVERLPLKVRRLPKEHRFTIATVGTVPYDVVLGLDWLTEHKVAWYFQSNKLRTYVNGQWCGSKAKARITSLVRQAAADTNDLRTPLHGLHLILALPEACSAVPLRLSDEWQGALCCASIGNQPTSFGCRSPLASIASVAAESDEESPWPTAKLEHTLFDEWINSTAAQDIPCYSFTE